MCSPYSSSGIRFRLRFPIFRSVRKAECCIHIWILSQVSTLLQDFTRISSGLYKKLFPSDSCISAVQFSKAVTRNTVLIPSRNQLLFGRCYVLGTNTAAKKTAIPVSCQLFPFLAVFRQLRHPDRGTEAANSSQEVPVCQLHKAKRQVIGH